MPVSAAFDLAAGAASIRGHSVGALCLEAAKIAPALNRCRDRVTPLDAYYIRTRYPNALPDSVPAKVYVEDQSVDALARAHEAMAAVRAHFDSLAPP